MEIERHGNESAIHRAQEHHGGLVTVGAIETDPVAGYVTAAKQEPAKILGLPSECAERKSAPGFRRDQERPVRLFPCLLFRVVPDRPRHYYLPRLA